MTKMGKNFQQAPCKNSVERSTFVFPVVTAVLFLGAVVVVQVFERASRRLLSNSFNTRRSEAVGNCALQLNFS
jgi:hypothetical protein